MNLGGHASWEGRAHLLLLTWLLLTCAGAGTAAPTPPRRGMIATGHPLATQAGVDILRDGGNAVDAAVAAALTLGVVDGHNSGIGGGCFILIRRGDGTMGMIDGRETAPARSAPDMFVRNGKGDMRLSQTGPLAAGVPGALKALDEAARKYGTRPLKSHLLKAAALAERGFSVSHALSAALSNSLEQLALFPSSRTIFVKRDGTTYAASEILKQPDLGRTYRELAARGMAWFYLGHFAHEVEKWMQSNGGIMTAGDFAEYRTVHREPLRATYRGFELLLCPPPSSGGVHLAQILNILEQFDLKQLGAGSADFIHVVAEAMKLAFADRAHWLGDPAFAGVPRGLASKAYGVELARKIRMERASAVPRAGTPPNAETDLFGKHTTHLSAADAEGTWVALTTTVNTSFGCKVVVPGTGVVLNNQMDDFSVQPGAPNYFGLVGSEANAVQPRKRPLSSMSPTLVLREGKPVLALGAAGGPTIISQTLLAMLHVMDFGMPVDRALAMPRFHHQWQPDTLRIEAAAGDSVAKELVRRGHSVQVVRNLGVTQAVAWNEASGAFEGVSDPRGEGQAAGW